METTLDLFQDTLVQDKLNYFRKKKRIEWLWTADLRLVNEEQELRDIVTLALSVSGAKAVDTETTGLRIKEDKLIGISISFENDGKIVAFYVPLYSDVDTVNISPEKSLSILKPILEQPCVYRNAKYDYKFLKTVGIQAGILADISTMELCISEGLDDIQFNRIKNMSLKERYSEIFNEDALELEEALGKGIYNFALAPLEMAKFYASTDAYMTLRLYNYFLTKLDSNDKYSMFIYRLETMLLPVVADMEYEGISIDTEILKEAKISILEEQKSYENRIYELCGEKLNLNSGPQLANILYTKLNLPCEKLTPGGDQSVDKDSLKRTLGKIPIDTVDENEIKGREILETLATYKENEKLLTAFVENLMAQLTSDGKVHPTFKTLGAISGRFSCSAPNLQQLPKAEDGNKAILRKAFIADPGTYFMSVDFSQVELKITASLCKDPNLQSAFINGIDVHKSTAALMFGKKIEEVTKEDRQKAKTINFGLIYGLGPSGLARQLRIPEDKAKELYEIYYSKLPSVKAWIADKKQKLKETGVSITHWGRKRLVPNARLPINWDDKSEEGKLRNKLAGESLRAGVNHIVQGTSADITKIAMVRLDKSLKGKNVIMLVQVHDQVIFQVGEEIRPEEIAPIIKEAMELKVDDFVPLTVDIEVGYSWGGCVKWKPGMTLDQVPYKNKVTIGGDVVGQAEQLKSLFNEFKGENEVFFSLGGSIIQPESIDTETGEVSPQLVCASKAFVRKIKDLGLEIN